MTIDNCRRQFVVGRQGNRSADDGWLQPELVVLLATNEDEPVQVAALLGFPLAGSWRQGHEKHVERYAARKLRRRPGYTTSAIVTLALGIGATTTIFSVVNGVVFRRLPFEESERLVVLHTRSEGASSPRLSPPNFMSLREETRSFTDVVGFQMSERTLTGVGWRSRRVSRSSSAPSSGWPRHSRARAVPLLEVCAWAGEAGTARGQGLGSGQAS